MAIKFWIAGCTSQPNTADKQMPDAKTWDSMVWHNYDNAYARYQYWKGENFKSGVMQQIYLAELVVDIFNPANNTIKLLAESHHPFKKTVVYNMHAELEKQLEKVVIKKNYLVQGESLAAAQSMWNDSPIQQSNPFAPKPATPYNNYAQPVGEPDWGDLYNELHAGDAQ